MKYFTMMELTVTHSGLPNIPNEEQLANLEIGVKKLLDPIREMWGRPIIVNSGFRSHEVNEAIKGSSSTSSHMTGQAYDIYCDDNKALFSMIIDHFEFDQLIDEGDYAWIHVSYREGNNRNQIFSQP